MSQDCHPEFRTGKRGLKWADKGMLYHWRADAPAPCPFLFCSTCLGCRQGLSQNQLEHDKCLGVAWWLMACFYSRVPAKPLCVPMNIWVDCCHSGFWRTLPFVTVWCGSNGAQFFLGPILSSLRLGSSIFQQDCLLERKGYMILVTTWRPLSQ